VDWLSLSPDEQWARYRAGVERTIEANPANVEAQVRYLGLLLNDGKTAEARAQAKKISSLNTTQSETEEATRLLLEAREYESAKELLARADARGVAGGELRLDAAVAALHLDSPAAALRLMDAIPQTSRNGDYELARATMLGLTHRDMDAAKALQAAINSQPRRSSFYRDEVLLLLQQGKQSEAVKLLDRGIQLLPQDPVLRAMRAMALAMNGDNTASQFEAIEARWPEWPQASVARAFVLGSAGKSEPAARALDAAETTGDVSSAIYFCQALLALNSTAPELDEAKALTAKGLAMSPDNHAARAFAAYLTELTVNRQGSADRRKTLLLAAELLFG
jgi:thioredoxin-like negative regulator of GroEL